MSHNYGSTIVNNSDKIAISAVLFDLDGTLLNTIPLILATHRHTFNKILGWIPSDEVILATIGEPLVRTFGHYGGEKGPEMFREYSSGALLGRRHTSGFFLMSFP